MDLFGWDTVFVGTIETVNQALARAGNWSILTFSFTEDGISASGTFGAWSIVPVGPGRFPDLCLPIASGQFTPGPGMRGIDLAGINVVLRVLGAHATDTRDLTFVLREVARKASQDPAKISVVSVSPTNRLTTIQRSIIGYAIAQYISAHDISAHAAQLIQTFSFTEDGISASGTFGAWSIVPGGSGQLLDLCLPIGSGQFTPASGRGIDLAGINVVLRVPLRWLSAHATDTTDLTFDLREVARRDSQDPAKISVVSVSPTNRLANWLTPIQRSTIGHAIAQYISAHAAEVSFVFASVDPGKLGTAAWLRPVVSEYVYVAPAGGATPMLAILSSLTARDVSSLPCSVDAGLLSGAGSNAAIAIAGSLLMAHIVAPAIAKGLRVGPERLVIGNDGRIRSNGSIDLPALGSSCPVSVTASLTDARLTLNYDGRYLPRPGISMTFTVMSELELSIDPASLSLSFRRVETPIIRKDIKKEWYIILLEALGELVPNPTIELVLEALVSQVSKLLTTYVQFAVADSSPDRTSLASVIWSGGAKFSPASGSVANALVLRGSLG